MPPELWGIGPLPTWPSCLGEPPPDVTRYHLEIVPLLFERGRIIVTDGRNVEALW